MKPDFGLRHLQDGYDKNVILHFYDVPFKDIGFTAPNSYTTTLNITFGDTVYAVSLDFSDDIFAFLLSCLEPSDRELLGSSLIGKTFPFMATLPLPVVARVVTCHRGELQRGAHDEFIPFVITDIK